MRLHCIAPFHTVASHSSSHCAFTSLAMRFAKMMQAQGHEVIEYANESESDAETKVPMLSLSTIKEHTKRKSERDFYDGDLGIGSPIWKRFDQKLTRELTRRFDPDHDIVCHGFGVAHRQLAAALGGTHLEPSIGYNTTFSRFRVYASYAWMHYHQGKENRGGDRYEWVIPHFVDIHEWTPSPALGDYLLYLGRIQQDKGMNTIRAIAERTKLKVVVCGQGDASPWACPNIEARLPVFGKERNALIAGARAMLLPTEYTEPGSVASIEALVCGTPVISSDHGVFAERVHNFKNGFRCHTLGDWMKAIDGVESLDRAAIATQAAALYSLETIGPGYDAVLRQIEDLKGEGWYTMEPRNLDYH